MPTDETTNKIYKLLAEISQNSPSQGLPSHGVASDDPRIMQALTTAHITTMYYSALINLDLQNLMPDDSEEMPRLQIIFKRSYADYTSAREWLAKNAKEYINSSTAKYYYDELVSMGEDLILDKSRFYEHKS